MKAFIEVVAVTMICFAAIAIGVALIIIFNNLLHAAYPFTPIQLPTR